MILSDVYSKEFLKKLNSINPSRDIGVNLINDFIDVKELLKQLGFKVKFGQSNQIDTKYRIIEIKESQPAAKQRFEMARGLGLIIANKYSTKSSLTRTAFASQFARELLMPKKLIKTVIKSEIQFRRLNADKLSDEEVQQLVKGCARKLKVSFSVAQKRISELSLFKLIEL